jgi:succinoglycan biosynthesis protein ExoA
MTSTTPQPYVSVVLPIRNEARYIRGCIEYLLQQDYPADRIEILIVDGRSTDNTRDIVQAIINEHPERTISLLDNPQQIVPPALNIGIQAARGEFIIRMDGHTVPDNTYITACVNALQKTGAANVGGLIRPAGSNRFGRAVALAQSHPIGAGDAKFHYAQEPQYVDTVYMGAFRKDIFASAGLFDESMIRNQDYEMNVRIRNAGGTVYLDPAIKSRYAPRNSPRKLWKQYFEYGWWRVQTMRRHPHSWRWRQVIPPVFVGTFILLLFLSFFLPWARPLFALQATPYLLALAYATFSVRGRVQDGLELLYFPVAVAILHFSWGLGFILNILSGGTYPYRAQPPRVPGYARVNLPEATPSR